MNTPRVLQVCPNDHPPFLELCRAHAAALACTGVVVDTVYFAGPTGAPWETATYFGIERGTRRLIDALRRYCAPRQYDLVVAHRYRAYQVVTRARGALSGAPIVSVAHEFGMFTRRRRRARQRLFGRGVRFAGVSRPVADQLLRDHPGLAETFVLPSPIDVERLDDNRLARSDARDQLGIPQSSYVVGVIGRLHSKKRPLLALEGFIAAESLPPEARLVFIGDGELRGAVESLAIARGVGVNVQFAGRLADAAQYLNAFDVLLFASGSAEAFGMALLEAMLARVPIVCADVPGPRSVLGPDGLYFCEREAGDTAAALAAVLNRCAGMSPQAHRRRIDALRSRVEREFSLTAVAEIYRGLFSRDVPHPRAGS